MLPYYGLITLAVIMFGTQFFFNDKFQKEYGSSVHSTFLFNFCTSITGLICLLIINKFSLGFTPFTLVMATGMPLMVKYLLSWSNAEEQPPRRATTTPAPTFIRLSKRVL